MGHQILEERALRADTARATPFDGAHHQQPHAAPFGRKAIWDVVHAGIQLEEATELPWLGSSALVDEFLHLGDGGDLSGHFRGHAQGRGQVSIGVRVYGQHPLASLGIDVGQQTG
jgi:hypothetical protein